MLRVAVPNKGTLSEPAAEILSEAGYRRRTDPKDLTVIDRANGFHFFLLRPKDIAIYFGSGQLDTHSVSAWHSVSEVRHFAMRPRSAGTGPSPTWRASGSPPRFRTWCEKTWRRTGSRRR